MNINKKTMLFITGILVCSLCFADDSSSFDGGGLQEGDVVTRTPSSVIRLGPKTQEMIELKNKIESLPSSQNNSITCENLNISKRRLRGEFESAANELEKRLHAAGRKPGVPDTFTLESIRKNQDEDGICAVVFGYSNNTKPNSRVLVEYDIEGNTLEIIQYAGSI